MEEIKYMEPAQETDPTKKEKLSKKQMVLKHLLKSKESTITQKQAAELYHSWRLSDIIYKLRHDGYQIIDVPTYDEKGHKNNYATYKLISTPLDHELDPETLDNLIAK